MNAPRAISAGVIQATAGGSGAVGIVQIVGTDARLAVERLCGRPIKKECELADLAGIDEGLVVQVRPDLWQIMPHGGPRVMQALMEELVERQGLALLDGVDTRQIYPEASSGLEADMLACLATAASPAAIDLLLAQPAAWEEWLMRDEQGWGPEPWLERARVLDHLLTPPTVAVVGRVNTGKSTLSNRLAGREVSIAVDQPGSTRDYVSGLAQLPTPLGALTVRWLDTPGSDGIVGAGLDALDAAAIEAAVEEVKTADIIIALRQPEEEWPDLSAFRDRPIIHVINKADLLLKAPEAHPAPSAHQPLMISALTGHGLDALALAIHRSLGLPGGGGAGNPTDHLWLFSPRLKALARLQDSHGLRAYIRPAGS